MKRYYYMLLLILLQSPVVVAQIGIGTKQPDESAALDITAAGKGLLIPRMTSDQRDLIVNPATALIIFNSTLLAIQVNTGTKLKPNWIVVGGEGGVVRTDNGLTSGSVLVGNSDNLAKEVQISGEASLNHLGEIRIDNSAVIAKKLTGYVRGSGKISSEDSVLQAIQKLDGNQSSSEVVSISNDYTLLLTDYSILCDTERGPFTIYLPEVSSNLGKVYIINKIDETSNELYIYPPIKISKTTTVSYLNYPKTFKIQSDGESYYIVN
jgi:hypothetical protein